MDKYASIMDKQKSTSKEYGTTKIINVYENYK